MGLGQRPSNSTTEAPGGNNGIGIHRRPTGARSGAVWVPRSPPSRATDSRIQIAMVKGIAGAPQRMFCLPLSTRLKSSHLRSLAVGEKPSSYRRHRARWSSRKETSTFRGRRGKADRLVATAGVSERVLANEDQFKYRDIPRSLRPSRRTFFAPLLTRLASAFLRCSEPASAASRNCSKC